LKKLASTFKALSDTNRLRIVKMLEIRPLCVCEITEVLQLATSTVSKHLSILKNTNFIVDEKEGKWVIYRLTPGIKEPSIMQLLKILKSSLKDDNIILKDRQMVSQVDRRVLCGN